MYKLQRPDWRGDVEPGVLRLADGAWIPFEPDNCDYKEYLKWLEEGNTPLPADGGNN